MNEMHYYNNEKPWNIKNTKIKQTIFMTIIIMITKPKILMIILTKSLQEKHNKDNEDNVNRDDNLCNNSAHNNDSNNEKVNNNSNNDNSNKN